MKIKWCANRVLFITITSVLLLTSLDVFASKLVVDREHEFKKHMALKKASILKSIKWEGLGPYFMGGRITDIAAYEKKPNKFLLATASGGLWLTENNGTTWRSLFDNYSSITLGDIAVSQKDENLIWAGTGEENSSRSSYAGTGIFKSSDGGKQWKNMGLSDSHHIAEIVIDPKNNDIVYVAVLGHLYTENEERGIYKTVDGGKNWSRVLFISKRTGFIDLVMDPNNPNVLYAAAWDKGRKAWNMRESGPESAIFKTVDGGKNWRKMMDGIPRNRYTGRIGLAISRSNPKVIYAFLDNQTPRPNQNKRKIKNKSGITLNGLSKMKKSEFLKIPEVKLSLFLKSVRAPKRLSAKWLTSSVKTGKLTLKALVSMLDRRSANFRLLNSTVIGGEVYRSDDGGKKWRKTHKNMLPLWLVSTYGYYFGQIYVSPVNEDEVYILGVPLMKSTNGGKSFFGIPDAGGSYGTGRFDVHPDHHALWIDPSDPKRILLGNDGGLNISYDGGHSFTKVNNIPLAQSYSVNYDMSTPYRIFTGLQDNGVNMGPRDFDFGQRTDGWRMILGGDGAFVQPDYGDPDTVYAAYQFGNIFRINLKTKKRDRIVPAVDYSKTPYRFNWLSPFKISKHNHLTLYMGGNKMLKSVNRGEHWFEISGDLSDKKHTDGDVPYATITAIDESPLSPRILYAGTDDGNVWVTRNGGASWKKIVNGLPKKWVTRIVASKFKIGRVLLTLTGYRDDDFRTYVYRSENFGNSWQSIKSNLPEESINVIREDTENENIYYLGSDLTVYVTLDMGKSWISMRGNLPTNAVYDLRVHPREKELIIGTHGRGVFVTSVSKIQKLTPQVFKKAVHFLGVSALKPLKIRGYRPPREGKNIEYYTHKGGRVNIRIFGVDKTKPVYETMALCKKGFNRLRWSLKVKGKKIDPGHYLIVLKKGETEDKGRYLHR